MTDPHWSRRYVGIGWADHGRDFSGLDCWGLVRLVLAQERSIALPSYDDVYVSVAERHEIDAALRCGARDPIWQSVPSCRARAFDVLLFRAGVGPGHVGIVVDGRQMLHTRDGQASRIEPWTSAVWARRLVGIYRHCDLGHTGV